jgi:hypothetical protein
MHNGMIWGNTAGRSDVTGMEVDGGKQISVPLKIPGNFRFAFPANFDRNVIDGK